MCRCHLQPPAERGRGKKSSASRKSATVTVRASSCQQACRTPNNAAKVKSTTESATVTMRAPSCQQACEMPNSAAQVEVAMQAQGALGRGNLHFCCTNLHPAGVLSGWSAEKSTWQYCCTGERKSVKSRGQVSRLSVFSHRTRLGCPCPANSQGKGLCR